MQSLLLPVLLRSFEHCGAAAGVTPVVLLPPGATASLYEGIHIHRAPTPFLPIQSQPGSVISPLTCSPRLSVLVVVCRPSRPYGGQGREGRLGLLFLVLVKGKSQKTSQ